MNGANCQVRGPVVGQGGGEIIASDMLTECRARTAGYAGLGKPSRRDNLIMSSTLCRYSPKRLTPCFRT
jgi:hypothetical protein